MGRGAEGVETEKGGGGAAMTLWRESGEGNGERGKRIREQEQEKRREESKRVRRGPAAPFIVSQAVPTLVLSWVNLTLPAG